MSEIISKYLSVIVPVYNEEESVPLLHEKLKRILVGQDFSYEVIYVDDGSTDGTFSQLQRLVLHDAYMKVIRLSRNFGQTAAISAGAAHSTGEILVFMDGDLQNDPMDIPRLLAKLDEGYDVVSGWRKNRKDANISRKLPSLVANYLISKVTGVHLHDYGCTLKAYRREVFQHIRLYGEMHRFIPAYVATVGAAVTEIEVTHHARRFGVSKYGISRTVRVVLDLMTFKFLGSFGTKPLYAFGIPGLASLLFGGILSIIVLGGRMLPAQIRAHRNPLLPISIHFSGLGMQCIMMGLLAELLMRTYHESQGKSTYIVRNVLSLGQMEAEKNLIAQTCELDCLTAQPHTACV
ncbi:MAG: glycosyltransferase family 2 protein [Ktedonobacteraceae bacterium]